MPIEFLHHLESVSGMPLPMIFALTAALLATFGIGVAVALGDRANRLIWIAELVSAAFLTSVLVLHLVPDLVATSSRAVFLAIGGAAAAWGLSAAGRGTPGSVHMGALMAPVAAIAVHSFLDGWVHLLSNTHDAVEGSTVSAGLIAHEFSEGAVVCLFCLKAFRSRWLSAGIAFVAAAASTPVGTAMALALGAAHSEVLMTVLLPIMTGFIAFVAVSLIVGLIARVRRLSLPGLASKG